MALHPFYNVEVIKLNSLDDFAPTLEHPDRIYLLNIGDGMELGFYVGTRDSRILRVGFHAAKGANAPSEHVYAPVTLSKNSGDSFLLFADPTLSIIPKSKLSWYLGTPTTNPDDWMEKITKILLKCLNTEYILVEGSSGGGFTAMRFSSRFSRCIAVPKIPQTDLFKYNPVPLKFTLEQAWSGKKYQEIIEEYPHRFRIADIYASDNNNSGNFIHIIQNIGDRSHVIDHLNPLILELGENLESFSLLKGRFALSRPYIGAGHIPIPTEYWEADAKIAINRLIMLTGKSEINWDHKILEKNIIDTPIREKNIKSHYANGWR